MTLLDKIIDFLGELLLDSGIFATIIMFIGVIFIVSTILEWRIWKKGQLRGAFWFMVGTSIAGVILIILSGSWILLFFSEFFVEEILFIIMIVMLIITPIPITIMLIGHIFLWRKTKPVDGTLVTVSRKIRKEMRQ
ncbi:MAG: hypothetical protein GF317_05815 [Candidatus Lokiarchaeota archaeon]|nr:hypothetical protein [Candidatus Lokiarchaeota archaeon]